MDSSWALLDCGDADGAVEGMMRLLEKGSSMRRRLNQAEHRPESYSFNGCVCQL